MQEYSKPESLTKDKPKPGEKPTGVIVWPNSGILAEYGLSGLTAPAGTATDSYTNWLITTSGERPQLTIMLYGTSATDSAITSRFISNGWTLDQNYPIESSGITMYSYSKDGFEQGTFMRMSGESCTIMVSKSDSEAVWPTSSYLQEYGLSGLSAPVDATSISWGMMGSSELPIFNISFDGSSANASAINNAIDTCFTSNGWTLQGTVNVEGSSMIRTCTKAGFETGGYTRIVVDGRYHWSIISMK